MSRILCRVQVKGLVGPSCGITVVPRARTNTAASMKEIISGELTSIREAGLWKHERIITSKQSSNISVEGRSGKILNFCANNYLGLSSHPEVIKAGTEAIKQYGAGLSSVRFICGTQDIHKELEAKIAKFHNREDAILYASCFDANAGFFETLLSKEDAVISDQLNHASIIDGIRLCKAKRFRYLHRNMEDLESILKETQDSRMRLIATDGVFSMDGNVSPLKEICDLADQYKALVLLDDAHCTGFFGKTGRGSEEHCGVSGRIDVINSTLGKALGGASGGYTTGPKEITDLLRNRSRPYLFSNTLPPTVVACAIKVFDILMGTSDLIDRLAANTMRFRNRMVEAGFNVAGDKEHPICPVMLGDAKLAAEFADQMLERGIYVIGFSYPVVPKGEARIRVQLSASHTLEDVDTAVDAFIAIGKKLKVIE